MECYKYFDENNVSLRIFFTLSCHAATFVYGHYFGRCTCDVNNFWITFKPFYFLNYLM